MSTTFKKAFEMKNLMMTAAVGALMLPSLGWSAADGRGHNGPNLAPTSIPVSLDHGISAGKVQQAMTVCFTTGDSKAGIVSVLHRLADEITGGHGGSSDYTYYGTAEEYGSSKAFYSKGYIYHALETTGYGSFRFYPKLELHDTEDSGTVTLQLPAVLPSVSYQSIVQDTGYDEYGRESKSDRILMGISINFDPSVYGTAVRLINSNTHVKSAITVNTVEYVECLKNELQRRAE
ncbi:MAG: hypothetical protein ACJ763_00930 [Bdellovibrionia bacterium]